MRVLAITGAIPLQQWVDDDLMLFAFANRTIVEAFATAIDVGTITRWSASSKFAG